MATSVQIVGKAKEFFKDLDLIALIYVLDAEKASIAHQNATATSIINMWKEDLRGYGPGTIDLKLEEMSHDARAASLKIVCDLRKVVKGFGEHIPASFLNDRNLIPGVAFYNFRTDLILETISRLIHLLSESGEQDFRNQ